MRRPSPAMLVALAALFVALAGTATAAGIVPLARRALDADKLQGRTAAQLVRQRTAPVTFQRGQRLDLSQEQQADLRLDCGPGAAPVGFGYDGALEFPLARLEGNVWHLVVKNRLLSGQVTNVYVTCVK